MLKVFSCLNTLCRIAQTGTVYRKKTSVVLLSVLIVACGEGMGGGGGGGNSLLTGTGGSTAKMTLAGDYLYAISGSSVQLFDVSTPSSPAPWTKVDIDWDIQTLFPYGDYLLIGAADGVHILDNTDPAAPQYVGDFQHATARDPVVAQDGIAYVTLRRDLTQPGPGIANQMSVLDISDVTQPALLDTVPMQGPSGLSVRGNRLYVCDGAAGLKIFDLTDPVKPEVVHVIPGLDCSDVIATDELLYVIDDLGLSQYDLSTDEPVLLSTVDTEPVIYIVDR
ncbi:MAG: hypothetical protein V3U76_19975 [Granulosicoccus sp.]